MEDRIGILLVVLMVPGLILLIGVVVLAMMHKAGLYHYQTTDHGKTWSKSPSYEPNAMIHADPVPEDEQPDVGTDGPSRTLFKASLHSTDRR